MAIIITGKTAKIDLPWSSYIPYKPHSKQAVFLLLPTLEAFFGGSVGGAKSACLLMSALQYVGYPEYRALILRRTFAQLAKSGALIDESKKWLLTTDAEWRATDKYWEFPSGARVEFGYLQHEDDKYNYQSAQYHFIGIDQIEQFSESQYRYMFSRIRKTTDSKIPLRMRSTGNPGGVGHEWVKQYFVDPETADLEAHPFIPSRLEDNPSLDRESYLKGLDHLDPITRRQLVEGDWSARHGGSIFKRENVKFVDAIPNPHRRIVRAWDLAATVSEDSKRTSGTKMSRSMDNEFCIEHNIAGKWTPGKRDEIILETAKQDGREVTVLLEEEPGSGGIAQCDSIIRMLTGYHVETKKVSGDKALRAGPLSTQWERGNVYILRGAWNQDFVDEYEAFTGTKNDGYVDRIDSGSLAFNWLADKTYRPPSKTLIAGPKRASPGDKMRETFGNSRQYRP